MKRKGLLTGALTLLLCLCFGLASFALPSTKDLVLDQVKQLKLNIDPGFYDKAESKGYLEVKKFDGTAKEMIGDLAGTRLDLLSQVDVPANIIKVNFGTDIAGQAHQADIYLADDKMVFTKDLLKTINSIASQLGDEGLFGDLDALPQYLYLQDSEFKNMWQQVAAYQKQMLPDELKDLLVFAVEAIPAECFKVTNSKVVINLQQADFEATVYNLAAKIKEEPERFADIILAANNSNPNIVLTPGVSPEELRAELVAEFEQMELPTKEQLAEISQYVDVNLLVECSLLPGGKKNFDFTVKFHDPADMVTGDLVFKGDFAGKDTNMTSNVLLAANVDINDGPKINFELKTNADYQGPKGTSNVTIDLAAQDNITEEQYVTLSLYGVSNDVVKPDLVIQAPQITEENSVDLMTLFPEVEIPAYVDVMINDELVDFDVWPYIQDGRTMVPVRTATEALGCTVEWVEPNEVLITSDDKVIQMYIGQTNYQVNGEAKQLDVAPYIEEGSTMVPVRFIAEALGATIELDDYTVVITK